MCRKRGFMGKAKNKIQTKVVVSKLREIQTLIGGDFIFTENYVPAVAAPLGPHEIIVMFSRRSKRYVMVYPYPATEEEPSVSTTFTAPDHVFGAMKRIARGRANPHVPLPPIEKTPEDPNVNVITKDELIQRLIEENSRLKEETESLKNAKATLK